MAKVLARVPKLTNIAGMASFSKVPASQPYKVLGRTADGVEILEPVRGGKSHFTLSRIRATIRRLRSEGRIPAPAGRAARPKC